MTDKPDQISLLRLRIYGLLMRLGLGRFIPKAGHESRRVRREVITTRKEIMGIGVVELTLIILAVGIYFAVVREKAKQ